MKVITIVSQKGGVGKTTTALEIYDCLNKAGVKTLFVDTDAQCNSTMCFRIDVDNLSEEDMLASEEDGIPLQKAERTIFNLFKNDCPTQELITHTQYGDIIAGSKELGSLIYEIMAKSVKGLKLLRNALAEVEEEYDYCIIDTPPDLGVFLLSALTASDYAVIPLKAEKFAVAGTKEVLASINEIKEELNPSLQIAAILMTAYDKRNELDRKIWNTLKYSDLGIPVFKTPIKICQDLKKAQDQQLPLSIAFPKSSAFKEYAKFTEYLVRGEF